MATHRPTIRPALLNRALCAGLLSAAAIALTGCQSIQGTTASSPEIRFLDASSDTSLPGLDFYLNKTALAYNAGYNYQTNYIPVAQGNYTVTATPDGSPSQALAVTSVSPRDNQHFTVIAGNSAANLQLTALTDQSTPAPTNEIDVRLIDQSTSSGAVDVYFVPEGGKLTTTSPVATDLTFGSNTGYLAIPSGTYEIAILPTGTVPIATTIASYTGTQVDYSSGTAQTFVIDNQQITTTPTLNIVTLNDYPSE